MANRVYFTRISEEIDKKNRDFFQLMKFTKLNSDKIANVNVFKYRLDFDNITGSKPEIKVKTFLKPYWSKDLVLSEMVVPGSRMRIDIVNISKRITCEISPKSSHSYSAFFDGSLAVFAQKLKREISKEKWCLDNGFKFIELGDDELKNLTKQMFKDKFDINL